MLKQRKRPSPHDMINIEEDDEMIIKGYISSSFRLILLIVLIIFSCGTLLILIAWKPSVRIRLTHHKCSLEEAQTLVLRDAFGEEYVESVIRPQNDTPLSVDCVHFYHKRIKYVWRNELNQFVKLKGLESEKCGMIYSLIEGLTTNEAIMRSYLYGVNSVLIEIKPIWKLIIEEITGPFYIYQMFIFTVWMVQLYYQFALCVLLLSIISVSMQVWQTRRQTVALREKVHSESNIIVTRDGEKIKKNSTELVPGDVIILPTHCDTITMECDAVLVSGCCTVDESMLSGESVPISKISLDDDPSVLYSPISHKKNTLFCGTQILHVKATDSNDVKAIVIRTGFSTAKGELVRSILFPKPGNLKLKYDLIKCMGIFFILGIPFMVYTAYRFSHFSAAPYDIVIIVIDVATFLVPPLLPAVMTSINAHAQRRLRKVGIFCLNPNAINACGGLDLVCFDKTGTLTEDSIDLSGVYPVKDGIFLPAIRNVTELPYYNKLLLSMGSCHSLTVHNGKVDGDNLDLKLFGATNWEFKDNYNDGNDEEAFERSPERVVGPSNSATHESHSLPMFAIIRQFPFESVFQRMIVIAKEAYKNDNKYIILMKGAPEMIASFCTKESVPDDFNDILESITRNGLRVIAAASRVINTNFENCLKMSREEIECLLRFEGLMVFQNCLKKQTIPALNILKDANIRSVMVTGDNILTAISVASNCGMINEQDSVIRVDAETYDNGTGTENLRVAYNYVKLPGFSEKVNAEQSGLIPTLSQKDKYHLAMEGKTFDLIRTHDLNLLDKVTHKGTIFARMSPDEKLRLIQVFQEHGHYVGMCGDGANDCGALRTANAGVSLSVAEASVASPFTYKEKDISCVPTLIREGRATLSATIGAFKYQVCYCFILLGAVLILFWDGSKPSDGAYVFVDIILNILPPMVFGTTEAYPHLVKRLPTRSVLSFLPQFSMYSFIIVQITLYLFIRQLVTYQQWYEPFVFDVSRTHFSQPSHIATTIFSVNMISYVISAIIFSPGPPFRKNIFSNKAYIGVVFLNFFMVSAVVLFPPQFILKYVNFRDVPMDFKMLLFSISLANFIFSYIWEVIILQGIVFNLVIPKIRKLRGPIHKFEKIENELLKGEPFTLLKDSNDSQSDLRNQTKRNELWIMRSLSNDNEIYHSPFNVIGNNDDEEESSAVTFTTFMEGTHRTKHENDRDSFV